ncbi:hypothetical protein ASC85_10730 [Pseudomonas sp. Root401]|nr:hypothetical protein ASC85_10730 [Pseudomonas sp. Root401]
MIAFLLWELARDNAGPSNISIDYETAIASRLAPTVGLKHSRQRQVGCQAASLLILIWGAPLTTLAERRHCAVGTSAWMPR